MLEERTFTNIDQIIEFRKSIGLVRIEDAFTIFARANEQLREFRKSGNAAPELQEFLKTFGANMDATSDVLQLTGGSALQVQVLENTMVGLVQSMDVYKFLDSLPRHDAASTFLEYNRILSWGSQRYPDSFVGELDDPDFDDVELQRVADSISIMSEAYSLSTVLPHTRTIADPKEVQREGAMHRMLMTLSRACWYGNRGLRRLEFNGLEATCEDTGNVIDAEGQLLDMKTLGEMVLAIKGHGQFGLASDAWMSLGTRRLYDNLLRDEGKDRVIYAANDEGRVTVGHIIEGLRDANAKDNRLKFADDYWIDRSQMTPALVANRDGDTRDTVRWIEGPVGKEPPNPPLSLSVSISGGPITGSVWKSGDIDHGEAISYRVIAVGPRGKSAPSEAITTSSPMTAGHAVNLVIEANNSGHQTTSFMIFRRMPKTGEYLFVREIPRSVGGATTFSDKNRYRPGTDVAFIGDFNSMGANLDARYRTIHLAELMPMFSTELPRGIPALRKAGGLLEWAGGLRVQAPGKFWMVRNLPSMSNPMPAIAA